VAVAATNAVSEVSRRLGLGGGSVIGGRVGLVIDPGLVGGLATGRRCDLVSGTNGKTTTTRLLAAALGGPGVVATSSAGANLPAGLAAALASAPAGSAAVLEVDEAYLGSVARTVSAEVIVLLNLSRDQLDRVNETRMLAQRWRDSISGMPDVTVVANADDPLVAWAAGAGTPAGRRVLFVAAGELWRDDATGCPSCGGRISFDSDGGWSCTCGFSRPEPHARLTPAGLELTDGRVLPISLSLPARCNRSNAAMAAVAARALGTDEAVALEAMKSVSDVEGRFSTVCYEGVTARLLLAKNPAGWAELLDLLRQTQTPVVIGINSRIADGHDPSWLWDVAFEELAARPVVATGERSKDLAVRLKYAGVKHQVLADQGSALTAPGVSSVEYVGNYTAFQQLRRTVSRRHPHSNGPGTAPRSFDAQPVPVAVHNAEAADTRSRSAPGRGSESVLRIAIVHPDLLGTYGDGGNGTVLACRAAWRGWPVELLLARSDKPLPTADIYCLGGGEDGPQVEAAALLRKSVLTRTLDNGAAVLAVCAGFQVVGTSFADAAGHSCEGLGLIDATTTKGHGDRCVGELVSDPEQPMLAGVAQTTLTGFENHSGLTRLGAGARPLGQVRRGNGNGDGSRTEGATCGRLVGTYMHGPVLARNPALADALLSMATGRTPCELDDTEEEALRSERLLALRHGTRSTLSKRTRAFASLINRARSERNGAAGPETSTVLSKASHRITDET
jgi:CobQ-like glutamine amidotransferase family enzyme/UDP-N-acetylmuramyl tripeptide synthase